VSEFMRKPPKGAKAFAIRIEMDLVIVSRPESEIDKRMIFDVARQQYECVSPELAAKMVKVKRILSKEDIPDGWEECLPWNDGDADLEPDYYIPSSLEALAEQAE
jgi:hypothetical protein